MEGVSGVFSVQNWWETGASREIQQGRNVAEAAKDARVPHLVYSSVGGAERNTDITHWKTKWAVENHVRQLGLPATILRPAGFMENYYIPAVRQGHIRPAPRDRGARDQPVLTPWRGGHGGIAPPARRKPRRPLGNGLGDRGRPPDAGAAGGLMLLARAAGVEGRAADEGLLDRGD